MYDNFFTEYEITEPPPIRRKTYSRDLRNPIDKKNINLNDYPMVVTVDNPDLTGTPAELDALNPFIFQTEQLPTPNDSKATMSTPDPAIKIVDLARSFVGGKYVYGGSTPNQGFDCSGLISYVYKQNGIDLGRSTYEIFKAGKEVPLSSARVGDIICTPGSGRSGRHVKMISKIDDEGIHVIEAKGKKLGITEGLLSNTSNIISIRRILGTELPMSQVLNEGISDQMARQIKIMESGSENPISKSAAVSKNLNENFATGLFGMVYEYDKPGTPRIKNGQTFSIQRWNNIFNAFHNDTVNDWKRVLRGKSGVTQDKLDALSSISMSGNWARPNGWWGRFVVDNWDNPQLIHDRWLKTGITAASDGQVKRGLVKRRKLEADWFLGKKGEFV